MKAFIKTLAAIAVSANLAACSTIGTVNGVPLDEAPRGKDDYCHENFAICLIGGLVISGAVVGIIAASEGNDAT